MLQLSSVVFVRFSPSLPLGGILYLSENGQKWSESVTKAAIDIRVSNKWVKFQIRLNYPFNKPMKGQTGDFLTQSRKADRFAPLTSTV